MKFRTSLDPREAAKGVRTIKDLLQRHWHLDSVGLGNCRAAQAILRELNEQLLIQSAALANANFNSDEPRDHYGQWTTGGAGGANTNSPAPAQPVKSGETSQLAAAAGQAHTLNDELKSVTEHATGNPFLRQLLQRALRVLTTFGPNSAGMKELSGLSKAIVADAAAAMMGAPEFGGNIRAFLLGKEMPVNQALRDSALEQQFRGETPTATVAGKLSENLAETLPMILAMRGLPVGVQKILTTIFTAKMLKDAPGIAKQLIEEFRKPAGQRDSNKIDSLVADAIETLGFTVLGMFGAKESSKGEAAENPRNSAESKASEPEKTQTESTSTGKSKEVERDEPGQGSRSAEGQEPNNKTLSEKPVERAKKYGREKHSMRRRAEIWERSKAADGKNYDPSGVEIKPGEAWQAGHRPGHKFSDARKHAAEQNMDIETWKAYQRDPDIYRPEKPRTNLGHQHESDY